jgi:hypothetical protein
MDNLNGQANPHNRTRATAAQAGRFVRAVSEFEITALRKKQTDERTNIMVCCQASLGRARVKREKDRTDFHPHSSLMGINQLHGFCLIQSKVIVVGLEFI